MHKPRLTFVLLALVACISQVRAQDFFEVDDDARVPAICVLRTERFPVDSASKLIVSVWEDGKIIASTNFVSGGPPYFRYQVPARVVKEAVAKFRGSEFFGDPQRITEVFAPDANSLKMSISWKTNHITLGVPWEYTPKEYNKMPERERRFYAFWAETKAGALSLIPTNGGTRVDAVLTHRRF